VNRGRPILVTIARTSHGGSGGRLKTGCALLVMTAVLACAGPAEAMPCLWLTDRYAVSCDSDGCKPLFRAVERRVAGWCARVTTVEPFPQWAESPILAQVDATHLAPSPPLVVIAEYHFVAETAEDLAPSPYEPELVLHPEVPGVVRAWYENRGAAQRHRIRKDKIIDGLLFAGVVALLAGSTGWLIRALRRRSRARQILVLLGALGLKALFVVSVFESILHRGTDAPPVVPLDLGTLAAVLLMPVDVALFLFVRWRRRAR